MASAMTRSVDVRFVCLLGVCALAGSLFPTPVHARQPPGTQQTSDAQQTQAPQSTTEDDRLLQLAEPDYRVINVPTTSLLPKRGWAFDLTHRFNGNLANRSFADNARSLFGIDDGATIGLEFRYAFVRRVQTAAYRTNFDRTIQIYGKYRSEEHTSELQSLRHLVCRLLLEK